MGQVSQLEILVVDDDPQVLDIAAASFEAEGHRVFKASNGAEALRLLDDHPRIALLFTDIVMPGSIDGLDLAELAKRRRPGLRVIYTSGYLKDEGVWEGTLLPKPWTPDDLKAAVDDAFAANASERGFRRGL